MAMDRKSVLEVLVRGPVGGLKLAEVALALDVQSRGRVKLKSLLEHLVGEGALVRGIAGRFCAPGANAAAAKPLGAKPLGANPAGAKPLGAKPLGAKPLGAQPPERRKTPELRATPPAVGPDGGAGAAAVGRIRVHPAGYGFVEREDGEDDVFVPARFRGVALDGDRVRLHTWLGHKGTEGRVEEVLARGRAKLTGTVRSVGRVRFLEPDDPRIASTYGQVAIDPASVTAAQDGRSVVAEIVQYPSARPGGGVTGELVVRVVHVLGDPDDPRTEVAKVIACGDIPDAFPDEVLAAARIVPQTLSPADLADRLDLRDREFLTIDPETARDFDDAICVEERPGGYRIWVAVADVSHYVREGEALDREARIRGFSVYLPDRAISMLPHELSAGICSLNPEVDRLAMIVRIDVDEAGVERELSFAAGVIRSHARLDYPGVGAALAGDLRGPRARYARWLPALTRMERLGRLLRVRRMERGALELDLPEPKVVLDADDPRCVRDVVRAKPSPEIRGAYQLVEEYMLAANEAVARFFLDRRLDTLYRVHDIPSLERLEEFATLARGHGLDFDAEAAQSPRALSATLASLAGKPHARALHFLLLRSLKQARYDVENAGHFGLASPAYLHFTSPIRRYPDLIVHRVMKYHLRREGLPSGGATHAKPPVKEVFQAIAAESSSHERRAAEAEREVVGVYRTFLMRDRVQEELTGVVSGVTSFGIFVECDVPFVEGLIKLERLGGVGWRFDEKLLRLVAPSSGRSFSLGDAVRVRVENVSVARRKIDFALVGTPESERAAGDAGATPRRERGRERGASGGGRPSRNDRGGRRSQRGTRRRPPA